MLDTTDVRPDLDAPPSPPAAIRRLPWHGIALGVICVAVALAYGVCEFVQFAGFRAGTYDLALFDQAVRSYSHFHLGISPIDGVHRGFGANFSVLGDHFSPILALLAPLYWVHSGPATLLVAQAVLVAAAMWPLWVFARRELGSAFAAYAVAVAYAVSWPLAQAVSFDFHEVAFAPLLAALLFERFSAYGRGGARWWHVALPAVGLLGVKEDLGLFVALFGVAVLLRSPWWTGDRRSVRLLGGGLVVGGLVTTAVTTAVVLPAFGSDPSYYWRYGRFGSSASSAALTMLTHPGLTAHTLVTPGIKVHTVVCLLGLAAFAALLSPWLLPVVPLVVERMLADVPNWWGQDFHYNAFVVVPLLCAGVDAVARLARWSRRWRAPAGRWLGAALGPLWAAAVLVIGLWSLPDYAFAPLLHPSTWQPGASARAASAAVARVPSGVVVETADYIGPALSGRTTVLLWDRLPRWAPWVVADTARRVFPFCSIADQRRRVDFLEAHGYRAVFSANGYVVLHSSGPLPPLDTARSPGC